MAEVTLPENWRDILTSLRQEGHSWSSIADSLLWGLSGDQLRKRYNRAIGRYTGLQTRAKAEYLANKWIFTSDRPRKHMVIPDTQIKPGERIDYLHWIGQYAAEKRPDVLVILGDWADMHSLSSYDRGKRSGENSRYLADIEAANKGLEVLFAGMGEFRPGLMVCTLGNHEYRLERFVNDIPQLESTLSYDCFDFEKYGIRVAPFLQPVEIDGVLYCHYVCRNAKGRVVQTTKGAPSAQAQIQRMGQSCTTGHAPGIDIATLAGNERLLRGIIAGSCYLHDEKYLSPQGNMYWRGIIVKHEVQNGDYSLMEVPLHYLERRYG